MTDLTAYLCCRRISAASVIRGNDTAISVSGKEITVKMLPDSGCISTQDQVNVWLEPNPIIGGRSVYYCKSSNSDYLDIKYPEYNGDILIREYPEITAKNGEHCHWFSTQVLGNGPSRCVGYGCLFVETLANSGGGEIPDDKNDVFPNLGAENTHQLTDNQISPGMLVSVRHYFFNGVDTITDIADSKYYTSPAFTGGIITAIHGSYGDEDITYTVSIEGELAICRSSDWVKWEVGDWVIVLKDEHIIIPSKIGDDGA